METEMILMVDTETANTIDEPLVYDFGAWLIDTDGNEYEKHSWVIRETFMDKSLMSSAYYAEKLPRYWTDIWEGNRQVKSIWDVYNYLYDVKKRYPNVRICAHNAAFDVRALHCSLRYLTKSKRRWMIPCGTIIYDTMRMAHEQICKTDKYVEFCKTNNFMTSQGRPQEKAETIYRYLTNNLEFNESHTGLEDVEIETEILRECYRRGGEFRKVCFNKDIGR